MKRSRALVIVPMAVAFLIVPAAVVVAAQRSDLGGKLVSGDIVTIPAGETVNHDVYVAAGTVVVDGTIQGDLVAAGGQVTVNGRVDGDVLAAGGQVAIGGAVTGDARVAGGQLTLGGSVDQDLLALGGQLSIARGGRVGEDLIMSAGDVAVDGNIAGGIFGSAGTYRRAGTVGGTEQVTIRQRPPAQPVAPAAADVIVDALRHFVTVVFIGGLALWLFPRTMGAAEEEVRRRPLPAAMGGFATIVGYIVLVIVAIVVIILLAIAFGIAGLGALAAIDVIGGLLALCAVTLAFVVAAGFLADGVVGLALAHLVAPPERGNRWRELALLAAGAAVLVVVTSIPVIGPLAKLVVVVLGLGALAIWGYRTWSRGRPAAKPAFAATPPAEAATG